jgi:hypothetical protein
MLINTAILSDKRNEIAKFHVVDGKTYLWSDFFQMNLS